jgi:hypothetical protein
VPLQKYEIVTIVGESSRRTWDLEPSRRVLGYSPGFNLDELGPFRGPLPTLLITTTKARAARAGGP